MKTGKVKATRLPRKGAKLGNSSKNASSQVESDTTRALAELRTKILRADFQPDKRISEVAMGTRLGLPSKAVRLALERLAHEGLVEQRTDGGFSVRTFTVIEIWDAIELRAVLEGTAARLACERLADPQELGILRGYANQIAALSRPHLRSARPDLQFFASYCDLNLKFHSALMDLARSSILRRTWDQVQSIPFAAPSSTILPEAMHLILNSALEQHEAMLNAISERNGHAAEEIARSHARLAFTNLDVALRSPGPGAALVKSALPPLFDSGIKSAKNL